MSTIKDVAKAAGVSVSTVSNIINNKSSVNIEIYNRVMQVMKEMNYRPNILAMNLRKNNMNFIGVVFHELTGYSNKLLEGVLLRLEQLGYQAIVRISRDDSLGTRDTIAQLLSIGVKGMILCTPHIDIELLQSLDSEMCPILMLEYCLPLPGFLSVEFDNTLLIKNTVRCLLESGKSVGIVTGPRRFGSEKTCWQGFVEAYKQTRPEAGELFDMELPFQRGQLYRELLNEIPQRKSLPSYFIVSNEFLADCLREVLLINGYREYTFYVLSSRQFEERNISDTILLQRDVIHNAKRAVDLLDGQIKNPVVNDSPGETIISNTETVGLVKKTYVNKISCSKTLRVLLPDVPMSESIKLLSHDFVNQTGIKVEFVKKNMTELRQEIIRSCQEKISTYDVVFFHINCLSELGKQGYLKRLDECFDFKNISRQFIPKIQEVYFKNDYAVYGIPADMGVQVLAYRDDIFSDSVVQKNYYSEVGMELHTPRSWTEFNIVANYFTRKYNPSSPVKYGTCIAGHIPNGLIEEFWPRSLAFRGKIFENQKPTFYTPQNIKALENLCDSYRCSYPDCRTFMDNEQVNEMLKGDIAMIVTYYNYMVLENTSQDKRIKFSHTPSNMTVLDGYLLGIPCTAEQLESSSKFIQWCISDEISVKSVFLGRLTPKISVVMNGEMEYVNRGIRGIFDEIDTVMFRNQFFMGIGNRPDFDKIMSLKLAEAVYDGTSPEKVMKELQDIFTA